MGISRLESSKGCLAVQLLADTEKKDKKTSETLCLCAPQAVFSCLLVRQIVRTARDRTVVVNAGAPLAKAHPLSLARPSSSIQPMQDPARRETRK